MKRRSLNLKAGPGRKLGDLAEISQSFSSPSFRVGIACKTLKSVILWIFQGLRRDQKSPKKWGGGGQASMPKNYGGKKSRAKA